MPLHPPPQFDRPYEPLTEIVEKSATVNELCHRAAPQERGFIYGCQFMIGNVCTVIRPVAGPGGVGKWLAETIRRFEIAHCNGMAGDHMNCALCRYLARHG